MYATSEDAMEANEAVSFAAAKRELARHYAQAQQPTSKAHEGDVFVRMDDGDEWETIPCTTRAILEWLGY